MHLAEHIHGVLCHPNRPRGDLRSTIHTGLPGSMVLPSANSSSRCGGTMKTTYILSIYIYIVPAKYVHEKSERLGTLVSPIDSCWLLISVFMIVHQTTRSLCELPHHTGRVYHTERSALEGGMAEYLLSSLCPVCRARRTRRSTGTLWKQLMPISQTAKAM